MEYEKIHSTSSCGCPGVRGGAAIGSDLYTGAAVLGRVYSVVGAIIGGIIALILIILGVRSLLDVHTATVSATITHVVACSTPRTPYGPSAYGCHVDVAYVVGGQAYTAKGIYVEHPDTPFVKGDHVILHYKPADPKSVVFGTPDRTAGLALLGFGLLIGGITTAIAVASFKYKGFAAGYGTLEGINLASSIL